MKGVPNDLDQLMWSIAESGDVAAADDFERRFPEWKVELESRIAMVRGLKHAKPASRPVTPEIPRFVPKPKPAQAPQRMGWVVALSATAVLAFSTFIYVYLKPPEPVPIQTTEPTAKTQSTTDDWTTDELPSEPQAANPSASGAGSQPQPQTPPPVTMPWEHRHDLAIEGAPLVDVLSLIGDVTKLKVEIAPNMPNPTVTVTYTQRTGMEMLNELGRQYGFTALDQGKGSVLIVPATAE